MDDIPRDKLSGALRRGAVKKHVAAIHVSGKLTLLQRKLSNVLLLNAYDTLTSRPSHEIDARTLCILIGYNSNDIDTLKTSLRGLAETVAEWDMLDEKGQQEWGVSSLLSYAKLKGGVCEYAYSPALAEKLHDPKVFALINLNIQRRFTSGHALALYENCYRFVRTGSTGWWSLDLFRRLMGVTDSSYYESYKHLNAKIIKPAVVEVNKTSNIQIKPEIRKRGRAVSEIRFLIEENPQLSILDIDDGDGVRYSKPYKQLRDLGVSDRLAKQWIAEHGEDAVAQKLDYVKARKNVRSMVGYLSAALEGNFHTDADGAGEAAPLSPEAERLRRVLEAAAARTPTQRDADKRAFYNRLKSYDARQDFERHGWHSALNAKAILAFWEETHSGLMDGIE
ncbi:replication initiation protein [Gymnodinialimonas sp. 2305UL16-5]|uniref:replication initiation protein n=1 Tax=Gymnodinialimonas mytili TaxID=3126503 RepID=UPI0030A12836